MNASGVPIKLIKKEEVDGPVVPIVPPKNAVAENKPHLPVEPHVQLVEVSPGVYDIVFTCKCGERTTIRCNSLELPSTPAPVPAVAAKKSAPPNEESAA